MRTCLWICVILLACTHVVMASDPYSDVTSTNEQGQTWLHIAVLRGDAALVVSQLMHGADLSAEDNNGETPFSLAVKRYEAHARGRLRVPNVNAYGKDLESRLRSLEYEIQECRRDFEHELKRQQYSTILAVIMLFIDNRAPEQ